MLLHITASNCPDSHCSCIARSRAAEPDALPWRAVRRQQQVALPGASAHSTALLLSGCVLHARGPCISNLLQVIWLGTTPVKYLCKHPSQLLQMRMSYCAPCSLILQSLFPGRRGGMLHRGIFVVSA